MKLVIFDLDGTLIDSLNDLAECVNLALKQQGFPIHPVDQYRYFVGNGVNKLIERVLPDEMNTKEAQTRVKESFDRYYSERFAVHTKPYPEILDLLEALKKDKIKTAVVSNKPDEFAKKIVSALFPENTFEFVAGGRDSLPKKPDPVLVNQCLEILKIEKSQCCYCGDSNVDIMTAQNAELLSIGAAWGFRGEDELREAGADYIIHTPLEMMKIIHACEDEEFGVK